MNPRAKLALFAVVCFLLGAFIGYMSSGVYNPKYSIPKEVKDYLPKEVKDYLNNFKVYIKESNTWTTLGVDEPFTRIIFWRQGGYVLSVSEWVECEWQIVVGTEDKPYQGREGDSCDVILKLRKLASGPVEFEIACLGGYIKRVYYGNTLLLDMATTQRYATGRL